jgi:hypothetical protein
VLTYLGAAPASLALALSLLAIDESQSKAYITDMEKTKRGTAIGAYSFFTGLVYLPASLIAGALWKIGPSYAFGFAAAISAAAFVFFISRRTKTLYET